MKYKLNLPDPKTVTKENFEDVFEKIETQMILPARMGAFENNLQILKDLKAEFEYWEKQVSDEIHELFIEREPFRPIPLEYVKSILKQMGQEE